MYRNVLFDFDGTVFDTLEGITKSVRFAINRQGLDAPLEELRCFAGPPLVDMFMEKFGFTLEMAEKATADFRERYVPIGLHECAVFTGVKELLKALRSAGIKTALATSKPQNLAVELLEKEGMLELFDVIHGSSPEGNNNAKWQIVQWAIDGLKADRDESVLVGDTKYDVYGAHQCGIKCIGVRYGYAAAGELEEAGADYIVKDTIELEALLLGGKNHR